MQEKHIHEVRVYKKYTLLYFHADTCTHSHILRLARVGDVRVVPGGHLDNDGLAFLCVYATACYVCATAFYIYATALQM